MVQTIKNDPKIMKIVKNDRKGLWEAGMQFGMQALSHIHYPILHKNTIFLCYIECHAPWMNDCLLFEEVSDLIFHRHFAETMWALHLYICIIAVQFLVRGIGNDPWPE